MNYADGAPQRQIRVAYPASVSLPDGALGDKLAVLYQQLMVLTSSTPERRSGHWIPFHSRALIRHLGKTYAQTLASRPEIERNDAYSDGSAGCAPFSKALRFADEHRHGRISLRTIRSKVAQRLATRDAVSEAHDLGGGNHYRESFANFALDFDKVKTLDMDGWAGFAAYRWSLGDQRPHRCSYGRFHSLTTSTPSSFRPFLSARVRSKPYALALTDVSCAQPFLLGAILLGGRPKSAPAGGEMDASSKGILYKDKNARSGRPILPFDMCSFLRGIEGREIAEEAARWVELCQGGDFYEWLSTEINAEVRRSGRDVRVPVRNPHTGRHHLLDLRDMSPKHFKRSSLIPIFSTRAQMRTHPVYWSVEREFPSIARWLSATKKHDHRLTAQILQGAESNVMVDMVGRYLAAKHPDEPVQVIHDALLVRAEFADHSRKIIRGAFLERFGVAPSVKVDKRMD